MAFTKPLNFLRKLKRRVRSRLSPSNAYLEQIEFDRIASEVKLSLQDGAKVEICQKLAQGVFYAYGMGVKGDIVEFGTMTGKTAVALATAISECSRDLAYSDRMHGYSANRQLYLFDSFEGLPTATCEEDTSSPHVSSGIWGKGTCIGLDPGGLQELCSRYLDKERVRVVKGWFKDTVTPTLKSPLALIHVDCDLYESAMDALDPIFSQGLVSNGAMLFFDDFNCNRSDPGFGERKAWSDLVSKYKIVFSDQGAYGIAGHRFIIHEYSFNV